MILSFSNYPMTPSQDICKTRWYRSRMHISGLYRVCEMLNVYEMLNSPKFFGGSGIVEVFLSVRNLPVCVVLKALLLSGRWAPIPRYRSTGGGLKFIGSTGISVKQRAGLWAPIKKAAKTGEVIHLIYVIKAKLICWVTAGREGSGAVLHG